MRDSLVDFFITWVPNCADRKVITPKGVNLLPKVADLIYPVTNNWDEDLVKQTFWPVDAQRILTIHLPQHDMDDFVAWSYTKNGLFSPVSLLCEVESPTWEETTTYKWNGTLYS